MIGQRRDLRGIRSPDFQELVGFEVMAQNYVIFAHILWRLFAKDWVELEFVVDSLLQMWRFFWCDSMQSGYFNKLSLEEREQVLQWVHDYHADAELVAALYHSAYLTSTERWQELRFALRDFWREMLCHPPYEVTTEILEEIWRMVAHLTPYQPPLPSVIVGELAHLARFETHHRFLRALERQYHYPLGSCEFERQTVWRETLDRPDQVECLVVRVDGALADKHETIAMLKEWMRFESLDYYRIYTPFTGRLLYYDMSQQKGVYWAKDRGENPLDLGAIVPRPSDWDDILSQMQIVAARVEERASLVLSRAEASAVLQK